MADQGPKVLDVLVAGAGVAGLALALAIRHGLGAAAAIGICDPALARLDGDETAAPGWTGRRNLRAIAVAAGSRRMFERLGVWARIALAAQPILTMALTDSRPKDAVRPVFLDFAGEIGPGEAFAHMVFVDDLRDALLAACRQHDLELIPAAAQGWRSARGCLEVAFPGGASRQARLVAAADGVRSRLREAAGIPTVGWDYGQSAIVATVAHERDHHGRAVQHFLPEGPLAVLPMRADDGTPRRFSLVWTESTAAAAQHAALADGRFIEALESRIGFELGTLRLEDRPSLMPLRLHVARRFIADRFALVGDAARVIHPLAGLGLNLGLRDVAALAESLTEACGLGLDPGGSEVLERYQRARRFDSVAMAASVDTLNRLFSNDILPVRLMRDLGLGLVDRAPGLKHLLIREAAGVVAAAPALIR